MLFCLQTQCPNSVAMPSTTKSNTELFAPPSAINGNPTKTKNPSPSKHDAFTYLLYSLLRCPLSSTIVTLVLVSR